MYIDNLFNLFVRSKKRMECDMPESPGGDTMCAIGL